MHQNEILGDSIFFIEDGSDVVVLLYLVDREVGWIEYTKNAIFEKENDLWLFRCFYLADEGGLLFYLFCVVFVYVNLVLHLQGYELF